MLIGDANVHALFVVPAYMCACLCYSCSEQRSPLCKESTVQLESMRVRMHYKGLVS
jgi:hypothetical protein